MCSLSLQLMCIDALLSLLDKDEKENLFLANVLVERARVQRGLPDQRCVCARARACVCVCVCVHVCVCVCVCVCALYI